MFCEDINDFKRELLTPCESFSGHFWTSSFHFFDIKVRAKTKAGKKTGRNLEFGVLARPFERRKNSIVNILYKAQVVATFFR